MTQNLQPKPLAGEGTDALATLIRSKLLDGVKHFPMLHISRDADCRYAEGYNAAIANVEAFIWRLLPAEQRSELRDLLASLPSPVVPNLQKENEILRASAPSDAGERQDLREVPDTKGSER